MKALRWFAALALFVSIGVGAALAQGYPNRPVRLVPTMPPGIGMDVVTRMIAQKLGDAWKQPVTVENRPGAAGNIGAGFVARSEPDGYTYLVATTGLAISPNIYHKLSFDPMKDLVPVSQIYALSFVMVVNPSVPATNVAELVALAKSQPGRLNYGSSGTGGTPHLAAELFKSLTGTDMVQVAYKGIPPMDTALLANEVQMIFTTPEAAAPYVKSGKMRALAVTGKTRTPMLPDVPTMVEAGLTDYELPNWIGLFAPAGTPPEVVNKMHADLVRALAAPEIKKFMTDSGNEIVANSPAEFAVSYKADVAKFARLLKIAKVPMQD